MFLGIRAYQLLYCLSCFLGIVFFPFSLPTQIRRRASETIGPIGLYTVSRGQAAGWGGVLPPGFGEELGEGGVGRPLHLRHAQGSPGGSLRALAWRQWMRARPSAAPRRRLPLIVPRWVRCGRVLGRGAGRGARLRATTGLLPPTQTLRDGSECWIGIQGRSGCVFGARLGWVWRRVHWRLWGGVHRCGSNKRCSPSVCFSFSDVVPNLDDRPGGKDNFDSTNTRRSLETSH